MAVALAVTTADREAWTSIGWSLAAHALLVAVMVLGGISLWQPPPPRTLGISAVVVDPRDLAEPRRRNAPPKPAPAPVAEPPPPAVEPDAAEQARAEAEERAAQARAAEQAAARKAEAERVARDKAAAQRRAAEATAKAAADKERAEAAKAAAQRERAEAARAKAEKDRAEAAKAAAEARRRQDAADLARQLADEERLASAADSGALAEYIDLIRQKVERNWVPPPSARQGIECEVIVSQLPGGQVGDVSIGRCNADDAVRRSIEAAVRRSDPLPLPSDPALFDRNLRFPFKPEE